MAKKLEIFAKSYDEMQVTPAAAVVAGEFATYDEVHGFYLVDFSTDQVTAGEDAALITKCELVKVLKAAGQAWAPGEAVYYHTTNHNLTNVVTGAVLVGHIVRAAASADTEGWISFDGYVGFIKT